MEELEAHQGRKSWGLSRPFNRKRQHFNIFYGSEVIADNVIYLHWSQNMTFCQKLDASNWISLEREWVRSSTRAQKLRFIKAFQQEKTGLQYHLWFLSYSSFCCFGPTCAIWAKNWCFKPHYLLNKKELEAQQWVKSWGLARPFNRKRQHFNMFYGSKVIAESVVNFTSSSKCAILG